MRAIRKTQINSERRNPLLRAHKGSYDVAVAGGGPGGLLAAYSLLKVDPSLKIKILERSSGIIPKGSVLNMGPEVLVTLAQIDASLPDKLKSLHSETAKYVAHGTDGNPLPPPPPPPPAPAAPASDKPAAAAPPPPPPSPALPKSVLARWYRVQKFLYELLPSEQRAKIEFNALATRYEVLKDGQGMRLHYKQNGSNEEDSIDAKVLLGCDGVNSDIRIQLLGSAGRDFRGDWASIGLMSPHSIILRGMVEEADLHKAMETGPASDELSRKIVSELKTNNLFFGTTKGNGFVFRLDDSLAWIWIVPFPYLSEHDLEPGYGPTGAPFVRDAKAGVDYAHSLKEGTLRVAQTIAGTPYGEIFRRAVELTPPQAVTAHLYTTTCDPTTSKLGDGPVTLLGESFHSLGPTGVGFSLASQDCYVLAKTVKEHGLTQEALRIYEEARKKPVREIWEVARGVHEQATAKGAKVGSFNLESAIREKILEQVKDWKPLI